MVEGIGRGTLPQVFRPDRERCADALVKVMAIALAILLIGAIVVAAFSATPVAYPGTYYMYPYPSVYYPIFF